MKTKLSIDQKRVNIYIDYIERQRDNLKLKNNMKTKTIIILIKIINNCMVEMFNGDEDAIYKYNRASWVLDDVIKSCINRGENPHTIEIDGLITIEREIFNCSHNKVLWELEQAEYSY